jgi:Cyclin, N-terminal domain
VLVGTSLFIAAKYEEIYAPPLATYQEVLGTYVSEAASHTMLECEGAIITTLDF